jgi:hypothetical protein
VPNEANVELGVVIHCLNEANTARPIAYACLPWLKRSSALRPNTQQRA